MVAINSTVEAPESPPASVAASSAGCGLGFDEVLWG
jgi:hypothetical protein